MLKRGSEHTHASEEDQTTDLEPAREAIQTDVGAEAPHESESVTRSLDDDGRRIQPVDTGPSPSGESEVSQYDGSMTEVTGSVSAAMPRLSVAIPDDQTSLSVHSVSSNISNSATRTDVRPPSSSHRPSKSHPHPSAHLPLNPFHTALTISAAPGTSDYRRLEELAARLSTEPWFAILSKPGPTRSPEELQYLVSWCKTVSRDVVKGDNEAFFQTLDDKVLKQLVKYFNLELYPRFTHVFHEGEVGDRYYLILRGRVALYVKQQNQGLTLHRIRSRSDLTARETELEDDIELLRAERKRGLSHPDFVRELEQGQQFGERALELDVPRGASIRTLEDCVFLTLDRARYKTALKFIHEEDENSPLSRQFKDKFVRSTYPLTLLPPNRRSAAAYQLKYESFQQGELIYESGGISDRVFFVIEGEVDVMRRVLLPTSDEYASFFNVVNLDGGSDLHGLPDDSASEGESDQEVLGNFASRLGDCSSQQEAVSQNTKAASSKPSHEANPQPDMDQVESLLTSLTQDGMKGKHRRRAQATYAKGLDNAPDEWNKLLAATSSAAESNISHSSVLTTTDPRQIDIISSASGLGPALQLFNAAAMYAARLKATREAELAWSRRKSASSGRVSGAGSKKAGVTLSQHAAQFLDTSTLKLLGLPNPKCFAFAGGRVVGSPLLGYHRVPRTPALQYLSNAAADKDVDGSPELKSARLLAQNGDTGLELEIVLGRLGVPRSPLRHGEEFLDGSTYSEGCVFGHEEGILPLSALFPPRGVVYVDKPIRTPDCFIPTTSENLGLWPEQRILQMRATGTGASSGSTSNPAHVKMPSTASPDTQGAGWLGADKYHVSTPTPTPVHQRDSRTTPSTVNSTRYRKVTKPVEKDAQASTPVLQGTPGSANIGSTPSRAEAGPRPFRRGHAKAFTFASDPTSAVFQNDDDDSDEEESAPTPLHVHSAKTENSVDVRSIPPGVDVPSSALSLLPSPSLSGMSLAIALSGYDSLQANSASGLALLMAARKAAQSNLAIPVHSSPNTLLPSISVMDAPASNSNGESPRTIHERLDRRIGGVYTRTVPKPDLVVNSAGEIVRMEPLSPLELLFTDRKAITRPRRHFTVYAASRTVQVYSMPLTEFLKFFDRTRRLLVRAAAYERISRYTSQLVKIASEPASDFAAFAADENERQRRVQEERQQTLSAKETRTLHKTHIQAMKALQERDQKMSAVLQRILAPSTQYLHNETHPSAGASPRATSTFSPRTAYSSVSKLASSTIPQKLSGVPEEPGPEPAKSSVLPHLAPSWLPQFDTSSSTTLARSGGTHVFGSRQIGHSKHDTVSFGANSDAKRSKAAEGDISSKLLSFSSTETTRTREPSRASILDTLSFSTRLPSLDTLPSPRDQSIDTYGQPTQKDLRSPEQVMAEADLTALQASAAAYVLHTLERARSTTPETSRNHQPPLGGLDVANRGISPALLQSTGRPPTLSHETPRRYALRRMSFGPVEDQPVQLVQPPQALHVLRSPSPEHRPVPALDPNSSPAAAIIVSMSAQAQATNEAHERRMSLSSRPPGNAATESSASPHSQREGAESPRPGSRSQMSVASNVSGGRRASMSRRTSLHQGSTGTHARHESVDLPTLAHARNVAAAAQSLVRRLSISLQSNQGGFSSEAIEASTSDFTPLETMSLTVDAGGAARDDDSRMGALRFGPLEEPDQDEAHIERLFEEASPTAYSQASGVQPLTTAEMNIYLAKLAEEEAKREEEARRAEREKFLEHQRQVMSHYTRPKTIITNKHDLLTSAATSGERFPLTGAASANISEAATASRLAESREAYQMSIEERRKNFKSMLREVGRAHHSSITSYTSSSASSMIPPSPSYAADVSPTSSVASSAAFSISSSRSRGHASSFLR